MTVAKAIARAGNDAAYKAKLLSNPRAALAEVGVEVPVGKNVTVMENTAKTTHVVLPVAPKEAGELSIDELEKVAGGRGAKAIARAWTDAAYKTKLVGDPRVALSEAGVSMPAGTTVKVIENTADTRHVVLPVAPAKAGDVNR